MNPHDQANAITITGIEMGIPQPEEGHMFYRERFLVTEIVPAGGSIEGDIQTYIFTVDAEALKGNVTLTVDKTKGTVSHDSSALVISEPWATKEFVLVGLDLHAKKPPVDAKNVKARAVKHKRMSQATATLMNRLTTKSK